MQETVLIVGGTLNRPKIIVILSSYTHTPVLIEVLLLGRKFSTSVDNRGQLNCVAKNSHWEDSDTDGGFKQGVMVCCLLLANRRNTLALPKKYLQALKGMGSNNNIKPLQTKEEDLLSWTN